VVAECITRLRSKQPALETPLKTFTRPKTGITYDLHVLIQCGEDAEYILMRGFC
jgi:hypothetical protein